MSDQEARLCWRGSVKLAAVHPLLVHFASQRTHSLNIPQQMGQFLIPSALQGQAGRPRRRPRVGEERFISIALMPGSHTAVSLTAHRGDAEQQVHTGEERRNKGKKRANLSWHAIRWSVAR